MSKLCFCIDARISFFGWSLKEIHDILILIFTCVVYGSETSLTFCQVPNIDNNLSHKQSCDKTVKIHIMVI